MKITIKTVNSWYQPKLNLTPKQEGYVNLVSKIFNMKSELGKPIPYIMTPYQVEFHANSLNVLKKDAQDILFEKARGISFTMSSCVDLILSAHTYPDMVFPIVAQRFDSAKSILRTSQWLIKNSNKIINDGVEVDIKDGVEMMETEIRFPNGSSIKPYPSGSASDSVRSLRLIRALIDEFAFQSRDEELLAAVQDTMIGELGQVIIGSTPCGINNKFYELIQKPVGFKHFRLPAFDETKFNVNKSIFEQNLTPIAPWLNLIKLETKRQRDENIFMQEQMCSFLDDSTSFLPFSLIKSVEDPKLINYYNIIEDNVDYVYDSSNPMYMGIDVARNRDLTAITIFEKIFVPEENKYVMVQRLLIFLKNKSLPIQEKFIERLFEHFPQIVKCRIDMTGIGLGVFEHLRKIKGNMVEGIHFAERVKTGQYKTSVPIAERMSINLKNLMQDGRVSLIIDDVQEKHLNDVDYNFKAIRRPGLGHGDMFYAVCLALLPDNYKNPQISSYSTVNTKSSDKLPILESEEHFKEVNKVQDMTWEQKFKYLKKTRRNII